MYVMINERKPRGVYYMTFVIYLSQEEGDVEPIVVVENTSNLKAHAPVVSIWVWAAEAV